MGLKDFIKVPGRDMKNDRNQNISVGFVIQPVHDQHKGNDTDEKVHRINQSGFNQIAVIIIFNCGKRKVPDPPV